jgi:simple sugar transport system ATP-binding protein
VSALLSVSDLHKRYGTIEALRGVDLDIGRAEIVAIVGDNGAGKSTLIKILAGTITPDAGSIEFDGRPVSLRDPQDAMRLGIETVYQDLALAPHLDIVSNIFLGRELKAPFPRSLLRLMDRRAMTRQVREELTSLDVNVPGIRGLPVGKMSGGQQQAVAIARSVVWASSLLIMDEPTAALGVRESKAVLAIVKKVRERGVSVVLISHVLPHVVELADRVVVLRHGEKVAELNAGDISADRLVALIVGIEAGDTAWVREAEEQAGDST